MNRAELQRKLRADHIEMRKQIRVLESQADLLRAKENA